MEDSTFVWSASDAKNGWCTPEQGGTPAPKGPATISTTVSIGGVPVETKEIMRVPTAATTLARERGIAATDAEGLALLMLETDPEGFARRNPTVYLDIMKSQRIERIAQAQQAQQLADLASGKIKALSTRQIIDKMIQALFEEGPETQARVLAKWDISAEDLHELGEAAAQGDGALDAQLGFAPLVEPPEFPYSPTEAPQEPVARVVEAEQPTTAAATPPERWEQPQPDRPTLDAWLQQQDR